MTVLFAIFLALHGLIHLLGVAKAFGLAALPQLTRPIPPPAGVLWLAAAVLFVAAAVLIVAAPRWWWPIGLLAVLISTAAIVPSWSDAKFGAAANAVALAGVVFGFLAYGPYSLRAAYERDVAALPAPSRPAPPPVTEADLVTLPEPVRRYLQVAGIVGRPRVRTLRARMSGRIRSAPDAPWMPFTAEQYSSFERPARLFYMTATRLLLPAQGYHRYVGASATMRIRAAALVPVLDAAGREMLQGETVTFLNDMCLMAPAALLDAAIAWEAVDARRARARFTNAGVEVTAELRFNEAGELVDFVSDDRFRASADGRFHAERWSTPLGAYRSFGNVRLASGGAARWHGADGAFTYIELTLDGIAYDVPP